MGDCAASVDHGNSTDVGTQFPPSHGSEEIDGLPGTDGKRTDAAVASVGSTLETAEDGLDPDVLTANKRKLSDRVESSKRPKKLKPSANPVTRPGLSNERFDETSYYLENGLRKVYPYYFTFTTHTKGRWVGRSLLEVFGKEFRAHSSEEYARHIEKGSLTINNEPVTADYVLKHNDLLSNVVHRHEVPVTSNPIGIVHIDKEIVVVNKPASMPVHPCGRYRHNTVIFLLAREHGLRDLKTIHRLDRLTSGVLMFGRTQDKARRLEAQIRDRLVEKKYVCRVEGRFPEDELVDCQEPIEVVSFKIGVCKVSPAGKPCRTTFRSAGYDEKSGVSVVLCEPHSGRMHQIRVHLQFLGYPIVNDPLYNDAATFGLEKGRGGQFGKSDEQLVLDLIRAHNAETWLEEADKQPQLPDSQLNVGVMVNESNLPSKLEKMTNGKLTHENVTTQTGLDLPDSKFDKNKFSVDPYCQECKFHYKDPKPKDLVMYLHAYKYSGPDWEYETPMPVWANVNWKEP